MDSSCRFEDSFAQERVLAGFDGTACEQITSLRGLYHSTVRQNCDVDQPRNLAKSVTVE